MKNDDEDVIPGSPDTPPMPFPVHGGQVRAIMRHFPDAPRPFVDLSTGINPNAYPLRMPSLESLTRLPQEDEERDLREVAARAYAVASPDMVAPGPGSQGLISLLPQLIPATRACIWRPTYSGHEAAWQNAGVITKQVENSSDFLRAAGESGTVCILCNPNNPDGRILPAGLLRDCADLCASNGNTLVLDEAFADLDGESLASVLPHPGLVILRSFGKTWGLPGVRLGFLLASAHTVEKARALMGSWPVSTLALAAGRQALQDTEWLDHARRAAVRAKRRLVEILNDAGMDCEGRASLFTLARTTQAAALWAHLCRHGIVTRKFAALAGCLRFGLPGPETEWLRLAAALDAWRRQRGEDTRPDAQE